MIRPFGTTARGETVDQITIAAGDLSVSLITLGAAVQDVRLAGVAHSLTLGSDNLADYETTMRHHGTLIGPVANRISTARVEIDGMIHELERNQDGRIHLHSGAQATHRNVWQLLASGDDFAEMQIALVDGQCGLPGNRTVTVRYQITAPATLSIQIAATTDAKTLMNFANHSYWNFDGTPTWNGHQLQISADTYLPGTPDFYPTGAVAEVSGTAMDFRAPRAIAPRNPPLDNNFCLSDGPAGLRDVLTLTGASGVGMTVATDQPGIQVYDGRDARRPGRDVYEGLAVEAQFWPDAPNNPHFPPITVTPDNPYSQNTQFRFFAPRP